jgi:hypothetical protein
MIDGAHPPSDKWRFTSIGYELGADEAHVWRASIDQPANVIAKLSPLLSKGEYQRAERFHRPADRRRFIAGLTETLQRPVMRTASGSFRIAACATS